MGSVPNDEHFMKLACRLARRGEGRTKPNPMVGAVLVKNGRIIGTGYHKKSGSPHAEVIAIQNASEAFGETSLYVNLEPCAHHGQTPPCVDLILARKIPRVVIGTKDPNPKVNGKSIRILKNHGLHVECGVLEQECRRLNETFFKFMETGRPFVTLKAALSLDGKIACPNGESQWISCAASRKKVHRLRRLVDAILVGIGTVLQDDPRLTARDVPGDGNPLRVILDTGLNIPLNARVLQPDAPTLIATTSKAPREKILQLERMGIQVEIFSPDEKGRVSLGALIDNLGTRGIQHMLIEGGSRLFTTAWEEKAVDKFLLFIAPLLLGGTQAPGLFGGTGVSSPAEGISVKGLLLKRSDQDLLLEGYVSDPEPKGRD